LMFDIISDLENEDNNSVNNYSYPSQYDQELLTDNFVNTVSMPSSPQEISSSVGVSSPGFPDNFDNYSPENMNYNMPNQYVIYDNNNIGYSYDPNTGTYIPVTVTVGDSNVNMQMYNNYGYTGNVSTYVKDENTRPRKRKRKSTVALPAANELVNINIKDYEDSLIALDSQTFDEYVEGAYRFRKYTEEEKEYFRDIRRRIKNRESARKSRMNKRTKLDTLSVQVKDLNDHTSLLIQENEQLKQENFQLKNEVIYLKNIINTHNHGKQNISVKEETKSSSPMGSHSILLFVMLFSFGILWNLDVSIFNSPLLHNTKTQFLSTPPPKTIEDPSLDKLLNNMNHDEGQNEETTQRFHNFKKDVEICC